jgi:hypothetical protein
MLPRATFGLAIVLATVSGSLAAPRGQAVDTQTVYNPSSGANIVSPSAPTVWGWPYDPAHRR